MYQEGELDTRNRENVRDNGEVFTPFAIVDQMLDLIPPEAWADPACCFVEPTCGNGQFLVKAFERRIPLVGLEQALNTLIGLDITAENVKESRKRLHEVARAAMLKAGMKPGTSKWMKCARRLAAISANNIVRTDDSLPVLKGYREGKGVLAKMKFVFDDPTGNGQVMGEKELSEWKDKIVKSFADYGKNGSNKGLEPFFRGIDNA